MSIHLVGPGRGEKSIDLCAYNCLHIECIVWKTFEFRDRYIINCGAWNPFWLNKTSFKYIYIYRDKNIFLYIIIISLYMHMQPMCNLFYLETQVVWVAIYPSMTLIVINPQGLRVATWERVACPIPKILGIESNQLAKNQFARVFQNELPLTSSEDVLVFLEFLWKNVEPTHLKTMLVKLDHFPR